MQSDVIITAHDHHLFTGDLSGFVFSSAHYTIFSHFGADRSLPNADQTQSASVLVRHCSLLSSGNYACILFVF